MKNKLVSTILCLALSFNACNKESPCKEKVAYELKIEPIKLEDKTLEEVRCSFDPMEQRATIRNKSESYSLYVGYGTTDNLGVRYSQVETLNLLSACRDTINDIKIKGIPLVRKDERMIYDVIEFEIGGKRYTRFVS